MASTAIPNLDANHALDYTLGALEIGTFISLALYGITTVQVYLYYSHYTIKDAIRIRILVPLIWILESVQTFSTVYYIYHLTVTNFGNAALLSEGDWSLNISALFDGLVGALVQTFFAHRIYALSGKWAITLVSWVGSFLALIGTAAVLVLGQTSAHIAEFEARYVWIATTSLVLLVFVDLVNMVALCAYLKIGRTGIQSTDHTLNKLFMWTIQTGILTSIGGLTMMTLSVAKPDTSLWIAISLFYPKLYSNSFMATLNGRETLRNVLSQTTVTATQQAGPLQFVTIGTVAADANAHLDLESQLGVNSQRLGPSDTLLPKVVETEKKANEQDTNGGESLSSSCNSPLALTSPVGLPVLSIGSSPQLQEASKTARCVF